MRPYLFASALICTFFLASCEDSEGELADPGYLYFPMNQGTYVVYEVDSIVYDIPVNVQDTFEYYIKEVLDTTYRDSLGRWTARIERFYRQQEDDPWVIKDIWEQNRTNMTAEKVEENVRYVKMGFPVSEKQTWDGNARNTYEEWMYTYEDIEASLSINDLQFDNTVKVKQREVLNLVEETYAEEIYAHGVGMISKDFKSCTLDFVDQEIETGLDYRLRVIEFGQE